MKWLALLFLMLPVAAGAQSKVDYKKMGAPIPAFSLQKTDGKTVTNTVFQKGKPAIVLIFSPDCEHCANMLDTLKTFAGDMKKTQMVLVTEARNKEHLKAFIEKKELDKYPSFHNIGWDMGNLVYYIYTYQLLPQVNVYSANHKLLRTFTGTFSLDSLRQYMQ